MTDLIASVESTLRPMLTGLPPKFFIKLYSSGRKSFLKYLVKDLPGQRFLPLSEYRLKLWGLDFACGLFNAAGMFKLGEGYELCASQGAGAYLAGTSTYTPRVGNSLNGVTHPFCPYPHSGAASNWMGLPNNGHRWLAKQLSEIEKKPYCPVGVSLSGDPGLPDNEVVSGLIEGFQLFDKADVDFIELNESCPNVSHEHSETDSSGLEKGLINRLEAISDKFLKQRGRNLPVIIKLSNDTDPALVEAFINLAAELGFNGVNFGNTSVNYERHIAKIDDKDRQNFEFFVSKYGGGISGRPLSRVSLNLSSHAVEIVSKINITREFHIIRTGGIEKREELDSSIENGILLNQWFTGYFDAFAENGHKLYRRLFP